jgi:hypothetical protein
MRRARAIVTACDYCRRVAIGLHVGVGSAVTAGRRWAGFFARFAAEHVDSNNVWQIEVYEGELSAGIQSGRGLCLKEDGSLCVLLSLAAAAAAAAAAASHCVQLLWPVGRASSQRHWLPGIV